LFLESQYPEDTALFNDVKAKMLVVNAAQVRFWPVVGIRCTQLLSLDWLLLVRFCLPCTWPCCALCCLVSPASRLLA
jgi:hypothetical protein